MDLDILLRGQSNAFLLADDTKQAIAQEVQHLLGFDGTINKVTLLADWTTPGATSIVGGSAFLGDWMRQDASGQWQPRGNEQSLLNFATQHQGATETAVVWLQNENDSMAPALETATWASAVRADAALLRQALGQDAAHAPYLFVSAIPYDHANDASNQAIRAGMEQLAADPAFHGAIAARALDLDMSYHFPTELGESTYGASHMSSDDAALLADRIARSVAQEWADYAQPGSPVAQAGGNIANLGPQVTAAHLVAPDTVAVTLAPDAVPGLQPLNAAAASGIGWSVRGAAGAVQADQASITGPDSLQLHFAGAIPADGQLFYGYGYGRLAEPDQPGHGNAVYDSAGLPAWTPATGMPLTGAAPALAGDAPVTVDWEALAARVLANYAATGHWYL